MLEYVIRENRNSINILKILTSRLIVMYGSAVHCIALSPGSPNYEIFSS